MEVQSHNNQITEIQETDESHLEALNSLIEAAGEQMTNHYMILWQPTSERRTELMRNNPEILEQAGKGFEVNRLAYKWLLDQRNELKTSIV